MCRIVGFVGVRTGVGSTTICFELSKKLAERGNRVCVIDFYFSMNDLSAKYEEAKFDLKDYLIGKIGNDGITEKICDNLYFIKSNSSKFDYLRFSQDITYLIKSLSFKFDYILIDINSFDLRILSLGLEIINEAYLIFDNEPNSIRMVSRYLKILRMKENIKNIKLLFNKSRIIGQLNKDYLSRVAIEEILNNDVIFEFPKFFKYNNSTTNKLMGFNGKIMDKFCNSFITNKTLHLTYSKTYKGIIGKIKKRFYEKFE